MFILRVVMNGGIITKTRPEARIFIPKGLLLATLGWAAGIAVTEADLPKVELTPRKYPERVIGF